jgi:hypothetical protein
MAGKKNGQVKQTPEQVAQAEVAMQQLADFKQRWQPLQQRLAQTIDETGSMDSVQRKQARGMVSTDAASKFGEAQTGLTGATAARGEMGSAKQKLAMTGMGDDSAMASGIGIAGADQHIDNAYVQGLGNLMAMGKGEKGTAMTGISNLAQMSGAQASHDANMALQRRMGMAETGGYVLGQGIAEMRRPTPAAEVETNVYKPRTSAPVGSEIYGLGGAFDGFSTNPQAGP